MIVGHWEPPLKNIVSMPLRHLLGLGVCGLLVAGRPSNLAGQAAEEYRAQSGPDLPRFTLRQIVTGSNDTLSRIPGPWLQAALAAQPESLALARYHKGARLSGVAPLGPDALGSERFQHMMGLYRRTELTQAARQTLTAIRANIPGDTARVRFDRLFRPQGEWVVDIHEAALAWARGRAPAIQWSSAGPALAAVRWLHSSDSMAPEAVPRALYGLNLLAVNDSAAVAAVNTEMGRADSASAAAVRLLLVGYTASQKWYTEALRYFLTEAWVPDGDRGRSLADYVREDWRALAASGAGNQPRVPDIRARLFGYPQAVPHYGVPTALFQHLVVARNRTAESWLERHGESGLLRTLRWLPAGDTSLVVLQAGSQSLRLTTLPRQSRESLNGFLEPSDVIAIDPGYSPLLAIGAVVHEWQHLLFRQMQLVHFAESARPGTLALVELPGLEPYLAEGFAEWSTERILGPLHARWPLLALGELEKRAGQASGSADDQHAVGYALVATLAATLRDPARTTRLLLLNAENPARIANHPGLKRAWKKYGRAADHVLPVPARRILIPEVTFSVEDGFPDVIASRIVVPPSRKVE